MTVDALNIGVYAEVPDHIPFRNRLPRGAYPAPGAGSIGGYYLQDKHEQWADNAGRLYEEGISRRWSTATDIPWETAHGLSDDVELAICQLATELSQHASVEARVIKEEAPPRRTNHPPRPPGTMPTLPSDSRDIGNRTLTELAHQYGWGSVYRFSEALRKSRRSIYDAARAVGRERANANLK